MVTSISAAFGQRVVVVDAVVAAELQETALALRRPGHRLRRLVRRPVRLRVVRLRVAVALKAWVPPHRTCSSQEHHRLPLSETSVAIFREVSHSSLGLPSSRNGVCPTT
jgi:hypothetical protein